MKLEELYEMQKVLDKRIIDQHNLHGQDLLPNTVLALQVEIAELASEWRGFKHWSDKREPKHGYTAYIDCPRCDGKGAWYEGGRVQCPICHGNGRIINPLLEEYVDCLHFFLSIARQLDLPADDLYQWEDVIEGETTVLFSELIYLVGLIIADQFLYHPIEDVTKWRVENLRAALFIFYALGEQRLGFTFEQIAAAYVAKNKVNHERQSSGY